MIVDWLNGLLDKIEDWAYGIGTNIEDEEKERWG